ncbi:hypothetical protein OOK27_22190 [Streptomyces canus]|uniref:hypothetical protein n=1 Tax=Streptomyces canus TaxID=58343 RepID=UPI0022540D0E|nr:hypothetical protein [Streptomyces canus]MCX5256811.1 hypothetical protein [Streptomyces canus]
MLGAKQRIGGQHDADRHRHVFGCVVGGCRHRPTLSSLKPEARKRARGPESLLGRWSRTPRRVAISKPISPQNMKNLAFIRLLHRQGIEQSLLPEPLSFTSVLTFHDAVEMFLIVAAEHLGAFVKDRDPFIKRFFEGLHPSNFADGVELQGQYGIKRLNDLRNGFKHTAGFPGPNAVLEAKTDTARFFEENTPRVFGLVFDDIDLAEVVQHDQTRARLKAAAQLDSEGSRLEAMGTLAVAFEELMNDQVNDNEAPRGLSAYSFGQRIPRSGLRTDEVQATLYQPDHPSRRGTPARAAQTLAREYTHIRDVTKALQEGMRLMVLGVDFHQYQRFTRLTPDVSYTYANPEAPLFSTEPGYAPNQDEFDFCRQFVITVALRLTEINARAVPPSWK